MLPDEARWIRGELSALDLGPAATVVDVGSQGEEYRSLRQPYIEHEVFRPLRERGTRVLFADGQDLPGVDYVFDLTEPESVPVELHAVADVAICASVLAHVVDRRAAVASLAVIVKPGGHLIVASPRRYPRTPAPIDTGYRPSPEELAADLSPSFSSVREELIASAPNALLVPDGPAHRLILWTARNLAGRVIRRRRMPANCLVSAVLAQRAVEVPAARDVAATGA